VQEKYPRFKKYPVDRTSDKILVISYPAGGFGHFIFYLLTHFTQETVKVQDELQFSTTGDSHHQHRYILPWFRYRDPTYQFDCTSFRPLDPNDIKIIIHDAGHDIEDQEIRDYFPNARFIKVCVEPEVRITLLELSVVKALRMTWDEWLDLKLPTAQIKNGPCEKTPWTSNQMIWRNVNSTFPKFCPSGYSNVTNVSLKNFIVDTERTFRKLARDLNLTVINDQLLQTKLHEWSNLHQRYIDSVKLWQAIDQALDHGPCMDLTGTTDWVTKSIIFYNVCNKYYIKVPVLEWLNLPTPDHIKKVALDGFTSTDHILNFVENYDSL